MIVKHQRPFFLKIERIEVSQNVSKIHRMELLTSQAQTSNAKTLLQFKTKSKIQNVMALSLQQQSKFSKICTRIKKGITTFVCPTLS